MWRHLHLASLWRGLTEMSVGAGADTTGVDMWRLSGNRVRVMDADVEVDCAGMLCPLPVLRARKRLLAMPAGSVLCLRATDPMAAVDVPHFCAEAGHAFLGSDTDGDVSRYFIRAKG